MPFSLTVLSFNWREKSYSYKSFNLRGGHTMYSPCHLGVEDRKSTGCSRCPLSRGQKSVSYSNISPMFLFACFYSLSIQSRGLAMGNSSWIGPSVPSLLLNMKSEDMGQGPALEINCPATLEQWYTTVTRIFLSPTTKVLVICPGQCPFTYSRKLP
jgi:hypothetical protein